MGFKPSVPKGTRDFSPSEVIRRNYIFETIRKQFTLFGFQPIETPSFENLSTLTGKYGDEGDKLIFRILNSGDFVSGSSIAKAHDAVPDYKSLSSEICDKALRYDLTVPFARYVVQHQHEIIFPFRRYQLQPVWRADRPQKGRYREFFQCDADVIGSNSILCEAELISLASSIFLKFALPVSIHVNSRKILSTLADKFGFSGQFNALTVAIDKFDKIGTAGVEAELLKLNAGEDAVKGLLAVFENAKRNSTRENLAMLAGLLGEGAEGVAETAELFSHLETLHIHNTVLDLSLARGLGYYTGTIMEVKALNVDMGSIGGGGRYDDLTGIFGLKGLSGVGISFGADRICDVLDELSLFPPLSESSVRVLFTNFSKEVESHCLSLLDRTRIHGINAEIYHTQDKLKKQFEYAGKKSIPFVAVVGDDEFSRGTLNLKNMKTGEQQSVTFEQMLEMIS